MHNVIVWYKVKPAASVKFTAAVRCAKNLHVSERGVIARNGSLVHFCAFNEKNVRFSNEVWRQCLNSTLREAYGGWTKQTALAFVDQRYQLGLTVHAWNDTKNDLVWAHFDYLDMNFS